MFRLVIADDELIAQKSLKLLVEKNFPDIEVVGIAGNGIELVSLVTRLEPDIAIIDITMPGMNGLEAIELLGARQIKTKFIINTAYDEFEFAKKAVGLKVEAYILKPEYQEQTIETIRKLKETLYEEKSEEESRHQIRSVMQRVESILENEIMSSIFLNTPDTENFHQYCEMHAVQFGMGTIVCMTGGKQKFRQIKMYQIRGSLYQTLHNCCNYLCSINSESLCILIFRKELPEESWRAWIQDLLSVVLENLRRDFGMVLKAGVGNAYWKFDDMSEAYHESLTALQDKKQGRICFYQNESEEGKKDSVKLAGSRSEPVSLRTETDNIYVSYAMKYIEAMYVEAISLEDIAEKIGLSPYYLSRLFKQELGLTFVEYLTDVRMRNALALIKNTKLSGSEIATKVGYSSAAYFTRVLKEYTGKKMTDIRMETKFKELE